MGRTPLASLRHPMDAPEEPQLGAWGLREGTWQVVRTWNMEYVVPMSFANPRDTCP